MKTLRIILPIFVLALALSIIVSAQPQNEREITFTVPVELQSIHENVYEIYLEVGLQNSQNQGIQFESDIYGIPVDRSTGAFSGNVTFSVREKAGHDLTTAVRYVITMYFHYRSSSLGHDVSGEEPQLNHPHVEARAREGTEFVSEVRGEIVWQ